MAIQKIKNLNEPKFYKIGNLKIRIDKKEKLKMPSWSVKIGDKGPILYKWMKDQLEKEKEQKDLLIEELKNQSKKINEVTFELKSDDLVFDFDIEKDKNFKKKN